MAFDSDDWGTIFRKGAINKHNARRELRTLDRMCELMEQDFASFKRRLPDGSIVKVSRQLNGLVPVLKVKIKTGSVVSEVTIDGLWYYHGYKCIGAPEIVYAQQWLATYLSEPETVFGQHLIGRYAITEQGVLWPGPIPTLGPSNEYHCADGSNISKHNPERLVPLASGGLRSVCQAFSGAGRNLSSLLPSEFGVFSDNRMALGLARDPESGVYWLTHTSFGGCYGIKLDLDANLSNLLTLAQELPDNERRLAEAVALSGLQMADTEVVELLSSENIAPAYFDQQNAFIFGSGGWSWNNDGSHGIAVICRLVTDQETEKVRVHYKISRIAMEWTEGVPSVTLSHGEAGFWHGTQLVVESSSGLHKRFRGMDPGDLLTDEGEATSPPVRAWFTSGGTEVIVRASCPMVEEVSTATAPPWENSSWDPELFEGYGSHHAEGIAWALVGHTRAPMASADGIVGASIELEQSAGTGQMVLAPPIGGVDRNDGYLVTYSATYSIVYADTIPAEGSCGEYGELGACELERCKEVRQGWAVKKSGGWEQIVTVLPYDVESALFFGLAHASKVIREEYFCESEPATIARTCPPGHVCNSYRLDTGYESYSDGFVRSAWDFYTGWGEYPFGQAWIYGGGEYRDYGGLPGDYSGTATGACGTGTGVVNARQFKGGKLIGRDVVLKTWSESNDDGPWPEIWDFNEVAPIVVPKVIQSAGGEALFDDTPTTSVRPEGLAELEVRALIPIGGV